MFKTTEEAIQHLNKSIEKANSNISKLTESILNMEGMSGHKTRHFYNNILEFHSEINYLEIGVWKGSSFISAMYQNKNAYGIGVDNFMIDQGESRYFFDQNLQTFLNGQTNFSVLDKNWHQIFDQDVKSKKFDVYLYDGPHEEIDHYDAIMKVLPYMQDISIILVDDWDVEVVREGTERAKKDLENSYHFLNEIKIQYTEKGRQGNTSPNAHESIKHPGWKEFWNGLYAAVIVRK